MNDSRINLLGAGVVIAAGFAWAAGSLYSQRAPLPRSPLLSSGVQMIAGGALLLLTAAFTGEIARFSWTRVSGISVIALLYLIVFGAIVAFTAYSWLLRVVEPARAATYAYVNPVVAVILGWAVAHEPISWRMAIGAGVIVASVAMITKDEKRDGKRWQEG